MGATTCTRRAPDSLSQHTSFSILCFTATSEVSAAVAFTDENMESQSDGAACSRARSWYCRYRSSFDWTQHSTRTHKGPLLEGSLGARGPQAFVLWGQPQALTPLAASAEENISHILECSLVAGGSEAARTSLSMLAPSPALEV